MEPQQLNAVALRTAKFDVDIDLRTAIKTYVNMWFDIGPGNIYELLSATRDSEGWIEALSMWEQQVRMPDSLLTIQLGEVSDHALYSFMRQMSGLRDVYTFTLHKCSERLPAIARSNGDMTSEIEWKAMQASQGRETSLDVLQTMGSNAFNYGCDAIMFFSDRSKMPIRSFDHNEFGGAVESFIRLSDFWIIPLDGNLGFVIGSRDPLPR